MPSWCPLQQPLSPRFISCSTLSPAEGSGHTAKGRTLCPSQESQGHPSPDVRQCLPRKVTGGAQPSTHPHTQQGASLRASAGVGAAGMFAKKEPADWAKRSPDRLDRLVNWLPFREFVKYGHVYLTERGEYQFILGTKSVNLEVQKVARWLEAELESIRSWGCWQVAHPIRAHMLLCMRTWVQTPVHQTAAPSEQKLHHPPSLKC